MCQVQTLSASGCSPLFNRHCALKASLLYHEVGWVVPLCNDGGIKVPKTCLGSQKELVVAGSRILSPCFNHWELSLLLSLKLPGWSGCVAKLQINLAENFRFLCSLLFVMFFSGCIELFVSWCQCIYFLVNYLPWPRCMACLLKSS